MTADVRSIPELVSRLRTVATENGFVACGVARPDAISQFAPRLAQFLADGWHGDMAWLAERAIERSAPQALWPAVRSAIVLGYPYRPDEDPLQRQSADRGAISCYAQGKDYHDVVKPALKRVARWLAAETGCAVKVFVDTAPVPEKPLAEAAGIGWQGKHTNLVSREHGSWLFLGVIYTDAALPADAAHADQCGSCRRCLVVCPTQAFEAPYRLDARRCVSYLTIEHKGHIDAELRPRMGNRIYGCDDCLAVCPWNKFAAAARDQRLDARAETREPPLAELIGLDDAAFRRRFAGTAIKRTGRDRFVRNVLIAAGNSGDASLTARIEPLLADTSPLVRAMAIWALARLSTPANFAQLQHKHAGDERDPGVQAEWQAASIGFASSQAGGSQRRGVSRASS
jgi:epoxyqueuosine reductase